VKDKDGGRNRKRGGENGCKIEKNGKRFKNRLRKE